VTATIQRTDLAFPVTMQIQNGTIRAAQPVMERIQRVGQSGSEAQETAIGGNTYLNELSGYFADISDDFGRDWTVYVRSSEVALSSGQYSFGGVTYTYRITAQMVLEAQP